MTKPETEYEEERLKELYWMNLPGMEQTMLFMGDTNQVLEAVFKPHQEEPSDHRRSPH